MKYPIHRLVEYAKCPQKTAYTIQFNKQYPVLLNELPHLIAANIIKNLAFTLSKNAQLGKFLSFKDIQLLADKAVYGPVDPVDIENKFQELSVPATNITSLVYSWYEKCYCKYSYIYSIPNLPLNININSSIDTFIYTDLDLLCCDKKNNISLMVFSDTTKKIEQIYNDLYFQILAWMVYKETHQIPIIEYLTFKNTSVTLQRVHIGQKYIDKTDMNIKYLCAGLNKNIYFTNVGQECIICPYKDICSF